MLSHAGPLPSGSGWSYELKWDGFRAIVSTEDGLRVRSRRGWNMTEVLPELRALPAGLVLDGELVAWKGSEPYFPLVCRRVLNRDMSIQLTFVVFDLLRADGQDMSGRPYLERRERLEALEFHPGGRPRSASTTGAPCSRPSASSASRAWSRSGTRASTGRASVAG